MLKIVVINGSGGCGKDTFVEMCQQIMSDKIYNLSTIDEIKTVATWCGWHGEKDDRSRKFLADLKQLIGEYSDIPFLSVCYEIDKIATARKNSNVLVFVHCREPKEIKRFVKRFNAKTLLVTRKNVKEIKTNEADKNVKNYDYDYHIKNNDGYSELYEKAEKFLVEIF